MSEATPEGGNDSGETPAADEFKAITSQEDLNKVLNERLQRERAKYADYKDLKTKATKLDEIEQANQTEAEKTARRIADLEAELNSTRAESMRLRIATEHGITDADDIDLFLTGTDEETLSRQAARLAQRQVTPEQQQSDNVATSLDLGTRGSTTSSSTNPTPADEFARIIQRQLAT